MCNQTVDNNVDTLEYISECFKTQKKKKCVIKLLILILLSYNSFINALKLIKNV